LSNVGKGGRIKLIMSKSYSLHDLPLEERPRERLQKVGIDALSMQELLALVIERGKGKDNVLTIAQNLLAHFGNLHSIKQASLQELQQVKGIGFATACKLKAAFKLGEKAQINCKKYGQEITTAKDVFDLLKNSLGSKKQEHFKLLCLDARNKLISIDSVSMGTLNASLAHPREVFGIAIKHICAGVILCHNHPSGAVEPSQNDLSLTRELKKAGEIIGINVLDHIIITSDDFLSFKQKRLI